MVTRSLGVLATVVIASTSLLTSPSHAAEQSLSSPTVSAVSAARVSVTAPLTAPIAPAASPMPTPDELAGVGDARQVVVVSNPRGTSYATLTAYQRTSSGWASVRGLRNLYARIGANGFVVASQRRQGTNTTPAGSFSLGYAFGTDAKPRGTRMPYRIVRPSDRWVYDHTDPSTYNTYQPSGDWENQERLYYIPNGQYRHVVVIGYNHPRMLMSGTARPSASPRVNTRAGGGIFLHVKKYVDGVSRPTAGCVSIDRPQMAAILRWLDPAKNPRIIMGARSTIMKSSATSRAISADVARGSTTSAPATVRYSATIGTSRDGRAITATRYGAVRPSHTLVVIGSIHGNETDGHAVVSALRSSSIPRGLAVWLIRTMNPDGVATDQRTNATGVDLNRNFPRSWIRAGERTSRYSGPSAASEPETRAVRSFLARVKPSLVVIFHSPLFGVDSYGALTPARQARAAALATASGFPLRSFDCTGGCHGTLTQWFNATLPGQAITFEFGPAAPSQSVVRRVAWAVLHVAATRT